MSDAVIRRFQLAASPCSRSSGRGLQCFVTGTIRMNMIGRINARFTRAIHIVCLGLLTSAFVWPADQDSSTITRVIDQLEAVHSFSDVSISPDGGWVAWVEPAPSGVDGTVIRLVDRTHKGAEPVRLTALADGSSFVTEESVAWSPDSKRLAFLSYASDPKQEQIYVAEPAKP